MTAKVGNRQHNGVAVQASDGDRLPIAGYCILVFLVTLLVFLTVTRVGLAASPHGPFSSATDKCSSCHRMHTSVGLKLLPQPTNQALCESCHAKGQGADTAVMEGTFIDSQNPHQSWGVDEAVLLGGGFNTIGGSSPVTGRHRLLEAGVPYGTASGSSYVLTCLSCHTPHYGPNYRLLRRQPGGATGDIHVTWNGPWTDASQTAQGGDYRGYTEQDFTVVSGYKEYTRNYQGGIAVWCAACHTKYTTRGPEVYDPGDVFGAAARYRHGIDRPIGGSVDPANGIPYNLATNLPLQDLGGDGHTADDQVTCLSCHRAHGTDVVMQGDADLSPAERGGLPAGGDGMLLRLNGREICRDCHRM